MKKHGVVVFALAALLVLLSVAASARDIGIIKGICKDEAGKPIAGATMEIADPSANVSLLVTTAKNGSFISPRLAPGSYKLTLTGADGKLLDTLDGVPARAGSVTNVDFDLRKLKAEEARQAAIEAQRKQNEKIAKENEKIRGINALLVTAAKQKQNKQYGEAVATLEKAAAEDTTHDIIYGALGDAYNLDKKYPQAEAAYGKAIALAAPGSRNLPSYHSGLALALLEQNKFDASAAECEKLAPLNATLAGECYYNQGAMLSNQGKAEAAEKAFDQCIAADPARAEAYYQKGILLLSKATLGKDSKMQPAPGTAAAFRKYLELAPNGAYAQSARNLLGSIGGSVQSTYSEPAKSR